MLQTKSAVGFARLCCRRTKKVWDSAPAETLRLVCHVVQRAQPTRSAHPAHLCTPCDRCDQQRLFALTSNWRPGWLSRYSDSLRAGRFGDQIPVWPRFSAPVQTGPVAHPASCTMDTGSLQWPGCGPDPPPPASVPR